MADKGASKLKTKKKKIKNKNFQKHKRVIIKNVVLLSPYKNNINEIATGYAQRFTKMRRHGCYQLMAFAGKRGTQVNKQLKNHCYHFCCCCYVASLIKLYKYLAGKC